MATAIWKITRDGRWPNGKQWALESIKLGGDARPHLAASAGYHAVLKAIRSEERRKHSLRALDELFDNDPNYAIRITVYDPKKGFRGYLTLGGKYGMYFNVPENRRFWNHLGIEIERDRAAAELALFCCFCLDHLYNDHHKSIADAISRPGPESFKFWPNVIRERYQLLILPPAK